MGGELSKAEGFEILGAVFALEFIDEGGKEVAAVFTVVPVHRRTTEFCDAVEDGLYVGIGEHHWFFVRKVAVVVALVGTAFFVARIRAHVGHGTGGTGGGDEEEVEEEEEEEGGDEAAAASLATDFAATRAAFNAAYSFSARR